MKKLRRLSSFSEFQFFNVGRLILGRYLIKNDCSSFLMPGWQELAVDFRNYHHVDHASLPLRSSCMVTSS